MDPIEQIRRMLQQLTGNSGNSDLLENEDDPTKFPIYGEIIDHTALTRVNEIKRTDRELSDLKTKARVVYAEREAAMGQLLLRLSELSLDKDRNIGYRVKDGKYYFVAW